MIRGSILKITVLTIFLTLANREVSALKCWRCSSDQENGEFCNEQFNPALIVDSEKSWSLVECSSSPGALDSFNHSLDHSAVCIKYKQRVSGRPIIARSCFWQDADASPNDCSRSINKLHVHISTDYCESCSTDGCNGSTQLSPIASILVIVMALAKIITL